MNSSQKIIESWKANAEQWIATIDHAEIESRKLATNEAIIKTVTSLPVKKVLDVGCGEGWLTRIFRSKGMNAYGVDAIETLIDHAIQKDGPFYFHYDYQQIAKGDNDLPKPFDAAAINFALIDKEDTEQLIASLPGYLKQNGYLVIQTLHPLTVAINDDYISGWKEGSWNGMKRDFVLPYQWYFRTLEDWSSLFSAFGFVLKSLYEPLHPETKKPLSVIFVLRLNQST
jgi:2-polyprenyl-3-methyl-5-hydroxy-6-metoxy-1,4-benzoquinol methylase